MFGILFLLLLLLIILYLIDSTKYDLMVSFVYNNDGLERYEHMYSREKQVISNLVYLLLTWSNCTTGNCLSNNFALIHFGK